MRRSCRYWILGLLAAMPLTVIAAGENPKEWISFWQKNYAELKPADDPRAAKADDIFTRLVAVAGSRPGVILKLYITKTEPLNERLPISLPDGSVILSKGDLDICYRDPAHAEDRLAFVLAHEIAHQLNNDFWHVKFFYAVEKFTDQGKADLKNILEMSGEGGEDPKRLQTKELMADSQGIIYASMAGFDTRAVVLDDDAVNFFEEWIQAVDPTYLERVSTDASHPNPKQRAEAVRARLKEVLDNVDLFNLGVLFYQAGQYPKAILAFNEFLKFFPSREVYHDLASSHHQLALKCFAVWKEKDPAKPIPFRLSMSLDPSTRAAAIDLRVRSSTQPETDPASLFAEHIDKAIDLYQKAIASDPSYFLAYNNLGCALIVKGDAYKAVGMFRDALKLEPNSAETLNNLGVAYFYAENPAKAKESLAKARKLAPAYTAPLFNLVLLAREEKNDADEKQYAEAYLQLDPAGPWAATMKELLSPSSGKQEPPPAVATVTEKILGLGIGGYEDEVPKEWGKPATKEVRLGGTAFRINTYPNRVMTLSRDDEIQLMAILEGCAGKTTKGIALGSTEQDAAAAYGTPAQLLDMDQGVSWLYPSQGIALQFRNGKVVSWVLF